MTLLLCFYIIILGDDMRNIAKKSNTMYLLDKYQLQALKKFGQNFIIDLNTVKKIVDSISLDQETCVIEIGPGIGALSEQLALKAGHVICYEIDMRLQPVLNESLGEYKNIQIIYQDFLKVDLKSVVDQLRKTFSKVCIVANLPYYITSDIIEKIITSQALINSIHVMVQKEVALKLTDKNYHSPLTYMIESIGDISVSMIISRHIFSPAPHIDSAILSIQLFQCYDPKLTIILKQAFTQKRKTIYNNLKELFKDETNNILKQCTICEKLRPEQLTLSDYENLTKYL